MISNRLFHGNSNLVLLVMGALTLYMSHRTGFITILSLYCILIFCVVPVRRYIDGLGIWVIAFTITFTFIGVATGLINSLSTAIAYTIPLPFFYVLGRYIQHESQSNKVTLYIVAFVILFYSLEIYLSIFKNIVSTGSIINASRLFYFEGNESRKLTATLVGLAASLGFAGLPMFAILKGDKVIRLFYFLLFLSSLITTINLVNRTGLVVWVFSFMLPVLYFYKRSRFKLIIIFCICFILIGIMISTGIISQEVISAYSERNELDLQTGGGRLEKWSSALLHIFSSPFGWAENNGTTNMFVHNMWLDVAKVTGIIPFFILLVSTVKSIKTVVKLSKFQVNEVVACFISLNICFFLSCFVEPVYGGMHMFLYVMIWGMQNQYLQQISSL